MSFEGRQWLYRTFWRLSERAALEEDLDYRRAILAAMLIIQELQTKGRARRWIPEPYELNPPQLLH